MVTFLRKWIYEIDIDTIVVRIDVRSIVCVVVIFAVMVISKVDLTRF